MTRGLSLFLTFLVLQIAADEVEEIKGAIARYHEELKTNESPHLHYRLALSYLQDQELDKSFRHYLLALKGIETKKMAEVGEEEKKRYEEAFAFYLNLSGNNLVCVANELIEKYGGALDTNIELRLLIATAYANLGQYDLFFKYFYDAFPYLKDSYLALKTQGILYLRLAHHSRLEKQRRAFQQEASSFLSKALEHNQKDPSLYKVLVFLAKDEKDDLLVQMCLQKIAENKVPIARGDIYLYVRECVRLGEFELGQKIINQASLLYDYSRAITAAQDYLNQHRG